MRSSVKRITTGGTRYDTQNWLTLDGGTAEPATLGLAALNPYWRPEDAAAASATQPAAAVTTTAARAPAAAAAARQHPAAAAPAKKRRHESDEEADFIVLDDSSNSDMDLEQDEEDKQSGAGGYRAAAAASKLDGANGSEAARPNSDDADADADADVDAHNPDYIQLVGEESDEDDDDAGLPSTSGRDFGYRPPWIGRNGILASPSLRLHNEIVTFTKMLEPTPQEAASRKRSIDAVAEVVRGIWPDAEVKVFGSFSTGLYVPTSDIDLVVTGSRNNNPAAALKALAAALQQRQLVREIQVLSSARVPIIKFEMIESGIAFDVCFDVMNGPVAAEAVRGLIAKWPAMKPLVLVLKVFLHQRELNEVYTGGIGSYALITMVASFLHLHASRRGSQPASHGKGKKGKGGGKQTAAQLDFNLGILLTDFFRLFGRALNMTDVAVSYEGFFPKTSRQGYMDVPPRFDRGLRGPNPMLAIADPQDPANNISAGSYNVRTVRSAFDFAYQQLVAPVEPNESLLARVVHLQPVIAGRALPVWPRASKKQEKQEKQRQQEQRRRHNERRREYRKEQRQQSAGRDGSSDGGAGGRVQGSEAGVEGSGVGGKRGKRKRQEEDGADRDFRSTPPRGRSDSEGSRGGRGGSSGRGGRDADNSGREGSYGRESDFEQRPAGAVRSRQQQGDNDFRGGIARQQQSGNDFQHWHENEQGLGLSQEAGPAFVEGWRGQAPAQQQRGHRQHQQQQQQHGRQAAGGGSRRQHAQGGGGAQRQQHQKPPQQPRYQQQQTQYLHNPYQQHQQQQQQNLYQQQTPHQQQQQQYQNPFQQQQQQQQQQPQGQHIRFHD